LERIVALRHLVSVLSIQTYVIHKSIHLIQIGREIHGTT
jgi:hypothetical protein